MTEAARQVLAEEPQVVRITHQGVDIPSFRIGGPDEPINFWVNLGIGFRRDQRNWPDAVCTCGQPQARRGVGFAIVADTCPHMRRVVDLLTGEAERRSAVFNIKDRYVRGELDRDAYVESLRGLADGGDDQAAAMLAEAQMAFSKGGIAPTTGPDLAQELFGDDGS